MIIYRAAEGRRVGQRRRRSADERVGRIIGARQTPKLPGRGSRVDERVNARRLRRTGPLEVAEELTMAARLLADVLSRLDFADWGLHLVYNWPERCERTLRWVAAHTLHDVHHHLLDAHRQLSRAAQTSRSVAVKARGTLP